MLDDRDAAILRAVWRSYWSGYRPCLRDVMEDTGTSSTSVLAYHVWRCKGAGLVGRGWLCMDDGVARSLRPGPRFKGLGKDGTIYQDADWPADAVREDRRAPKWDRRGELIAV